MISFFGVEKFKISIFGLGMSTRGHITFPGLFVGFNRFSLLERSKTALKPLKSCLKNRSKITARNERFLNGFFKQDLSGLSGFSKKTAQTAQTAQTA